MQVDTQSLVHILSDVVKSNALLNHHFYRVLWVEGKLPADAMRYYAGQWRYFESHFTRFMSNAHASCDVLEARQVLSENMAEEEGNIERSSHLELWDRFSRAIGCAEPENAVPNAHTAELVDAYYDLSKSGWKAGVCAMYAYESQAAEIAKTKVESLVAKFGISSDDALEFFNVHAEADKWHTAQWENIFNKYFNETDRDMAIEATKKAAECLIGFLDGNMEYLKGNGHAHLCGVC